MKKVFLLLSIAFSISTNAQQKIKSIELSLLFRDDKQVHYVTTFGDVTYKNELTLWGKSYGVGLNYHWELLRNLSLVGGIGYQSLGVSKIQNLRIPSFLGEVLSERPIDYTDPDYTARMHYSDKYHYDNIALKAGVLKSFPLFHHWKAVLGTEALYLYNFMQAYSIDRGHYQYYTHNNHPFGFQWNGSVGIIKEFEKFYLSPRYVQPLYQKWKKDRVFGEDPTQTLSKWCNGYGFSVALGKFL